MPPLSSSVGPSGLRPSSPIAVSSRTPSRPSTFASVISPPGDQPPRDERHERGSDRGQRHLLVTCLPLDVVDLLLRVGLDVRLRGELLDGVAKLLARLLDVPPDLFRVPLAVYCRPAC